jgi:hypothetical protein
VLVVGNSVAAGRPFRGDVVGQPDGQTTDQPSALSALTDHVTTLREQLAKAQGDLATREEQFAAREGQLAAERDREREAADHARRAGELDREGCGRPLIYAAEARRQLAALRDHYEGRDRRGVNKGAARRRPPPFR